MKHSNRDKQLETLGDQMSMIGKTIRVRYDNSIVCTTPMLDKVLKVIESESSMNIKRLARLLQVTSGAATQHVAALEELGALNRVINTQDRREIMVHITPQGHTMLQQIEANSLRVLSEVFAGLNDAELNTFTELITKASTTYQSQGGQND